MLAVASDYRGNAMVSGQWRDSGMEQHTPCRHQNDLPAIISTQGDTAMRVMVIVKASKESEAGVMPKRQLLEDMNKFNEELTKAGVMVAKRWAASNFERQARAVFGRQADGD
jgi:hypothetical protein